MSRFQQSNNAQCLRILDALRKGPVTTIDMMRKLDIIRPSARVCELREAGHNITTYWTSEETECGDLHRVARYVLEPHSSCATSVADDSPASPR